MIRVTLGDYTNWKSIVCFVLLSWVGIIFINRLIWSFKALNTKEFSNNAPIHLSTVVSLVYMSCLTYWYSLSCKGLNNNILSKVGVFLYFIANFSIWMFYWQRHLALSTKFHRRVKKVGLVLFTFCLSAACVLIFIFWKIVNNPDNGAWLPAETYLLGFPGLYDDLVVLIFIMLMDLICSTFISLSFIIPLWELTRSIRRSTADSWNIGEIIIRKTLRRVALCSFIATFSTVVCIACYMVVSPGLGNQNEDIIIFLDGAVNLTAVQYSMAAKLRWSPICCCPLRFCKCMLEKVNEAPPRGKTEIASVNYVRINT